VVERHPPGGTVSGPPYRAGGCFWPIPVVADEGAEAFITTEARSITRKPGGKICECRLPKPGRVLAVGGPPDLI
jgi:hypothetical protein